MDDQSHPEDTRTPPSDGSTLGLSADIVLAMDFVAEAGKQMLESSTSVTEVQDELYRFLPAVGLDGASLDANLSTLTVSYYQPGQTIPVTIMRTVKIADPRLERMTRTMALLEQVEQGEITLEEAFDKLRAAAQTPGVHRQWGRAAILISVTGWVLFLNGPSVTTVLVALLATLLALPAEYLVGRLRLPKIAGTVLAAIILAAIPNLLRGAGLSFVLSAAVVGGLFIYLPGRPFVTAVIDGLANAPISAITRAFEAIVTAGALALGVLVGGRIGAGLGVELQGDASATPVWLSVLGAAIGVLGLAVAWGMPRARVLPAGAIGAVGWLIVALTTEAGGLGWVAYFLAAILVGFAGTMFAYLQGGSPSVYTAVAILPLVPGFTLYQGVIALTQETGGAAGETLIEAATISLAIAGGVAIGLAAGRNLGAVHVWITGRRRRQ